MSGWRKVRLPQVMTTLSPDARGWQREVHDGHLSVFVATEDGRCHMSISHRTSDGSRRPGRYPTWDEIKDARYRFCPLKETMAMLLPPQEEFVNVHETTFHLWELPPEQPPQAE